MPSNDDFDLSSLFQGPGAVLAGVLGVADNARKTVGGVMDTIASLQRAAVAVEALVSRMNRLVDDLELPLRSLIPEVEKSVARMQRVATALEGPVDRLIPGLEAAVGVFDRVALSQLPETVDEALQQLQTLVDTFTEIPRRLGLLGGRTGLSALLPLGFLGDAKPVLARDTSKLVESTRTKPSALKKAVRKRADTSAAASKVARPKVAKPKVAKPKVAKPKVASSAQRKGAESRVVSRPAR